MTAPRGSNPQSIYEQVVAQLADHGEDPFAYQRPEKRRPDAVPFEERGDLILAEIRRFPSSAHDHLSLHARLAEIGFPGRLWYADEHDFGPEEAVTDLARWLIRNAGDSTPLLIGLTMLRGRAGPEDADVLRHLALHPYEPGQAAIALLAALPGSTEHLLWLAEIPGRDGSNRLAVAALCGRPEAAPWLMRHAMSGPDDWTGNALRVAQAIDLPRALREHGDDVAVVRNAAHILLSAPRVRTGTTRGGITGYADVVESYEAFAEVCDRLPDSDRGLVERMVDDLYFHIPALIDWPEGKREEIAGRLTATVPRENRKPFHIAVAGTGSAGKAALSLLVHGRPLLTPEFFTTAPPWYLLESDGGLRASEEPHEVELANGDCVPSCCGGLFVTIRKDGDEVVWDGWRQMMTRAPESFPDLRLDAREYEAELTRATRAYTARHVLELASAGDEQALIAIADDRPNGDLAVRQLCLLRTPSTADWLRRNAIRHDDHVSPRTAHRIADATDLATALTAEPDAETVTGATRILLATAMPSAKGAMLLDRPDALAIWRALGDVATALDPVPLARVLVELRTGQTAALPWDPGEAGTMAERLIAALPRAADPWADRVADWLERPRPVAAEGFDALSLERPPISATHGEASLVPLVNGVPVFPGVFNARMDTDALPRLLTAGRVRVHSGDCHDGCGATYADIRRDGHVVTWHVLATLESHRTESRFRFEASAYDHEIERARTA